jgi:hypothetical protein
VFLPNGVMEEFGCTMDSLEYYLVPSGSTGKAIVSNWLLDLITEPDGNQIHIAYQQDLDTAYGLQYPRDAVLKSVQWDSPTCSSPNTACLTSGTAPNLWKPLMQVTFTAGASVESGTGCAPRGFYARCDTPLDLSGSNGISAPLVQSNYVLNDIDVQVADKNSAWHTVRKYIFSYDQTPPGPITDPLSAKQESTAGHLLLKQLKVVGDDLSTALPLTNFTYARVYQYYEDSLGHPNPATNCGPSWNTGNGADPTCRLWSQSYEGNSYYLASVNNGLGLNQSFSWVKARDNMHGVTVTSSSGDPLYCTNAQAGVPGYTGGSAYPCDMADDETWSRVVLSKQTNSLVRLAQAGQGGTQTATPVDEITNYTYHDVYPLPLQECASCLAGYSWGDETDNDWVDFYNGKFMGFQQVDVSKPDGSTEKHIFTPRPVGASTTTPGSLRWLARDLPYRMPVTTIRGGALTTSPTAARLSSTATPQTAAHCCSRS